MKNRKPLTKIFWGLLFIAQAILIVLASYQGFSELFPLIFVILVTPVIIASLIHLNFTGIFIPVAFLGIVFSKQLGIENLTPWPILIAAVLLSIGFSVLFRKRSKWSDRLQGQLHLEENRSFEEIEDDEMTCTVKFGSATKYIISENFKEAYLNCSVGAIKAYFDNAKLSPDGAHLHINASISGIALYIPKHWKVANNVSTFMSGVEEKSRNIPDPDSPVLNITGNISLSGIVIFYI